MSSRREAEKTQAEPGRSPGAISACQSRFLAVSSLEQQILLPWTRHRAYEWASDNDSTTNDRDEMGLEVYVFFFVASIRHFSSYHRTRVAETVLDFSYT